MLCMAAMRFVYGKPFVSTAITGMFDGTVPGRQLQCARALPGIAAGDACGAESRRQGCPAAQRELASGALSLAGGNGADSPGCFHVNFLLGRLKLTPR